MKFNLILKLNLSWAHILKEEKFFFSLKFPKLHFRDQLSTVKNLHLWWSASLTMFNRDHPCTSSWPLWSWSASAPSMSSSSPTSSVMADIFGCSSSSGQCVHCTLFPLFWSAAVVAVFRQMLAVGDVRPHFTPPYPQTFGTTPQQTTQRVLLLNSTLLFLGHIYSSLLYQPTQVSSQPEHT